METMQRLTVTERTERRPVTIRSRDVERYCRSIVNQLVNSMPKDVLLKTSFTEHRTSTHIQATEEVRVRLKFNYARKVHPGTRQCPGSQALPTPDSTTCPWRQGEDNRVTKFSPGSRFQSNQGTEFCPESRETSQTDQNIIIIMWNPLARVMTRGPSPGRKHQRLLPILMFRRLRFIPC